MTIQAKDRKPQAERRINLQNIGSVLASLIAALFPCIYLVIRNYSQLGTDDLLISFGVVILHWLVLFSINYLVMRNIHKASTATTIAVIPLSLFHSGLNLISSIIPSFYYWHGIILVITICGILWYLIRKHLNQGYSIRINQVFGSIFLILVLVNFIFAVPDLLKNRENRGSGSATATVDLDNQARTGESLPNIYLFIFDEYSGYEALQRYLDYDNQDFYDQLSQLGFNTSKTSRNYTIWSTVEISNMMNLSINGSHEFTKSEKDQWLLNPYLFTLMQSIGYDLNLINDQGFFSTDESLLRYQFTPQGVMDLDESLFTLLIDKSVYYPLRSRSSLKRILEINELFSAAKQSSLLQNSNLFTVSYIMFPHNPWVFDEFGNETAPDDQVNWLNPEIYLGQLKYSSKLIIELMEETLKNDPDSCIIILSDHAYRYPRNLHNVLGIEIEDYDKELYYMRNIFGAVYLAGEPLDIEGYSGINIIRMTLNKLLDLDLELIEEPVH
ncbi:MAG: hypothetical protein PHR54_07030 [Anaerolineaceae bacterium]|jgi:hypothetical protein|nr:hypothetical protein [Anaerolineaceae bacterium]